MNPLGSKGLVEKNPEIEGEKRSVLMTLLSIMMPEPCYSIIVKPSQEVIGWVVGCMGVFIQQRNTSCLVEETKPTSSKTPE